MARAASNMPNDPVLVVIEDRPADLTFDEWLALLAADEPTDENAQAASIVREIRELGER
jgi:hypothetical protein